VPPQIARSSSTKYGTPKWAPSSARHGGRRSAAASFAARYYSSSSEVVDVKRTAWIEAAKEVLAGRTTDLRCPVCRHDTLDAEWLPFADGTGGEFRLRCRTCGAENFVVKRQADSED
jgi:hypothetical protein